MREREHGRGPVASRLNMLDRIVKLRRARGDASPQGPGPGDATPQPPVREPEAPREEQPSQQRRLEERLEHLEAALEGLQDAVHRESVRQNERITALEQKTRPEAMAEALSTDARERGL